MYVTELCRCFVSITFISANILVCCQRKRWLLLKLCLLFPAQILQYQSQQSYQNKVVPSAALLFVYVERAHGLPVRPYICLLKRKKVVSLSVLHCSGSMHLHNDLFTGHVMLWLQFEYIIISVEEEWKGAKGWSRNSPQRCFKQNKGSIEHVHATRKWCSTENRTDSCLKCFFHIGVWALHIPTMGWSIPFFGSWS